MKINCRLHGKKDFFVERRLAGYDATLCGPDPPCLNWQHRRVTKVSSVVNWPKVSKITTSHCRFSLSRLGSEGRVPHPGLLLRNHPYEQVLFSERCTLTVPETIGTSAVVAIYSIAKITSIITTGNNAYPPRASWRAQILILMEIILP